MFHSGLSPELSRQRQKRLLDVLQKHKLDAAVIAQPHHVYYFSAFLPMWFHQAALVLTADGEAFLTSGAKAGEETAADEMRVHESAWLSTRRQDQPALAAEHVMQQLAKRRCKRIGLDAGSVNSQVAMQFDGKSAPIDADLWQMRRRKDADELALMKTAIRCTEAMYQAARKMIEPGVTELKVFCELHAAAVATAQEPLTALLGNDFASGCGGGWARGGRVAHAWDIYILDLGPTYRGYFADNARSFAVNRQPTVAQLRAWRDITDVFPLVQSLLKPGARGRDIFAAVDEHMKSRGRDGMPHHLGHGVGLEAHEYPHLNPKWDDTLIEGEVVTVEPGLYGPEISGGMRIENQYLITAGGCENLMPFPLELVT